MLQLLDGPSLDALEELADEPVPGSVIVLACRVPGLAVAAAETWARRILGSAFRRDFLRMAPAGDRWLVGEVAEVEKALSVFPAVRHVMVLERAEDMDARVRDRLLRVLEEPSVPVSVILVVPDTQDVPPTLRGRASAVLTLQPAPPPAQVDALVAAGFSSSAAKEAVALAGPLADVLPLLAGSPAARAAVKAAVSARLDAGSPIRDAVSRADAAARAACALLEVDPAPWEDLSPEGKTLARRILRVFFGQRRHVLAGLLARVPVDQVSAVVQAVEAVDRAERRLRMGVSPTLVLTALGCESPPVRMR